MGKTYCAYILASKKNGTLYIGVTGNLPKRMWEHRTGAVIGFTKKYGVHMLVYYECGENVEGALMREKELKRFKRKEKIALIERGNPKWKDLSDGLV